MSATRPVSSRTPLAALSDACSPTSMKPAGRHHFPVPAWVPPPHREHAFLVQYEHARDRSRGDVHHVAAATTRKAVMSTGLVFAELRSEPLAVAEPLPVGLLIYVVFPAHSDFRSNSLISASMAATGSGARQTADTTAT